MTPGEASAQGATLVIHHPAGGDRVAAHTFDLEQGGIGWLDSGYTTEDSSHAAHLAIGKVVEVSKNQWRIERPGSEDVEVGLHTEQPEVLEGPREGAQRDIDRLLGNEE